MAEPTVEHELLSLDELSKCTAMLQAHYHDLAIVNGIVYWPNFCVTCKEGGLTEFAFEANGSHYDHKRVHVYKDLSQGVQLVDVQEFTSMVLNTNEIAIYSYNGHNAYTLRRRSIDLPESPPLHCYGCETIVSSGETDEQRERNAKYAKVCSIECLVKYDTEPMAEPRVEHKVLSLDEVFKCTAMLQAHYHDFAIMNGIVYWPNFCVTCNEGGLTEFAFEANGSHYDHKHFQVYKEYSSQGVQLVDVQEFTSMVLSTNEIAIYDYNGHDVYTLRRRSLDRPEQFTHQLYCNGCKTIVSSGETDDQRERNAIYAKVCSIECLVEYDNAERPVK